MTRRRESAKEVVAFGLELLQAYRRTTGTRAQIRAVQQKRLDEVFQKAFQADPEKRYRTPQELSAALDRALGGPVRA